MEFYYLEQRLLLRHMCDVCRVPRTSRNVNCVQRTRSSVPNSSPYQSSFTKELENSVCLCCDGCQKRLFFLLLLLDDLDFYLNFFFGNSQKVMKSYLKRVQILWMRIIWFKKKKRGRQQAKENYKKNKHHNVF